MAESEKKTLRHLTDTMETTLQILQSKFQNMSDQIVSRIDEMGTRIDDLERNVAELMTQAGMEDHQTAK